MQPTPSPTPLLRYPGCPMTEPIMPRALHSEMADVQAAGLAQPLHCIHSQASDSSQAQGLPHEAPLELES
eukprot:5678586-Amphidinium_carterae.1